MKHDSDKQIRVSVLLDKPWESERTGGHALQPREV